MTENATETEVYDPDTHTVDDVVAYLKDNPDQVATVQAAEAAGRNRKGIADYKAPEPEEPSYEEEAAATSPEPIIQEGTEDYDRVQVYP